MGHKAKVILVDVETDGLDYTKIHCAACKVLGEECKLFTNMTYFAQWMEDNSDSNTIFVGHNICGFDYWVINELTTFEIPRWMVYDTSVMSKLIDYRKYITHSLKELSVAVGSFKGDYNGGWDEYSGDMGEYCKQDVEALEQIYLNQKSHLWDSPSAKVEHEMAFICTEMQRDGFKFNKKDAEDLLSDVHDEMSKLESAMAEEWPAELVEDRRIAYRKKADGTLFATCIKAMDAAPKWKVEGDELILYKYKDFNPGSSKDRIDKLWDAGWKPFDKTEGHKKFERSIRW